MNKKHQISSGVRQGLILSPLLFLIVMDCIIRRTIYLRSGIMWDPLEKLEYLEFADDLCLLTENEAQLQLKINCLIRIATKAGFEVS